MFKGKYGSLQFLKSLKLNVPEFSVITHQEFVSYGKGELYDELQISLNQSDQNLIIKKAELFINSVKLPHEILTHKENTYYAVRSSGLMEDSPEHSFAGIFETKLFINAAFADAIKEVWLSLFQPKALQYCLDRKLSWSELKMDIILQEMISGEKSGVLFQADPMGKITEQVIVAGLGLGPGIVNEETDTDRYVIEEYEIKESHISDKHYYLTFENSEIRKKELPYEKKNISVLSQSEIEKLLTISVILSTHTEYFLDVEFTFRGNELFILQARPITTLPSKKNIIIFDNSNIAENYPGISSPLTYSGLPLVALSAGTSQQNIFRGIPCSSGIVETQCEVVRDLNNAPSLNGKILVAERTDPAWGYFFVGVKGIIIEKGSMLSHAAIISRELGIPCIINVKNATEILKSGMKVRMNGETGEIEILP